MSASSMMVLRKTRNEYDMSLGHGHRELSSQFTQLISFVKPFITAYLQFPLSLLRPLRELLLVPLPSRGVVNRGSRTAFHDSCASRFGGWCIRRWTVLACWLQFLFAGRKGNDAEYRTVRDFHFILSSTRPTRQHRRQETVLLTVLKDGL